MGFTVMSSSFWMMRDIFSGAMAHTLRSQLSVGVSPYPFSAFLLFIMNELYGGRWSPLRTVLRPKFPANREKYREFFYFCPKVPAENCSIGLNPREFWHPLFEFRVARNREVSRMKTGN